FEKLLSLYPNRIIDFMEAGYPSGSLNLSNEEKQAAFVSELFRAWDQYPSRVRAVNYTWMTDISPQALDQYRMSLGSDPIFLSYLSSIGLRTYNENQKAAFARFSAESQQRGFGRPN